MSSCIGNYKTPYATKSICPECLKVIDAKVKEKGGKVIIEKTCKEHGTFTDTYWSDAEYFKKAVCDDFPGAGVENPRTKTKHGCPYDCGLCPNHKSHTALALIDVTNRCNLHCPICFANAATAGYVYEPSLDEIREILVNFKSNRPVPAPAVQFAGGEPTVRKDFPEIVRTARDVGFTHIEVATNGIRIARDLDFAKAVKKAGLSTLYLQFDGVTPEPYKIARGRDLFPLKLKALENCRKAGLHSIVLVPTVVRGVNDNQLGDILRFAIKNKDIIRGINFQPVSITGRINKEERAKMRITVPDIAKLLEQQTDGMVKESDFYACCSTVPLSRVLGPLTGKPGVEFSCHPACGAATYLFIEEDGTVNPITHYVDYHGLIKELNKRQREGTLEGQLLEVVEKFVKDESIVDMLQTLFTEPSYEALGKYSRSSILVGSMHFMDPYNFDLDRVSRCVINYGVPAKEGVPGPIIPFCSMNSIHRPVVEKALGVPIDTWLKSHRGVSIGPTEVGGIAEKV
nr:radical SAM protein [Candidatus Njordarchaeum guaymaensis]